MGAKLVEAPIRMAQSQERKITVPDGPEEIVVKAFHEVWKELKCDETIFNAVAISRVYGGGSVALLVEGEDAKEPINLESIAAGKKRLGFNIFDPLNTSGSLVLSQDPNSMDFLKSTGWIVVQNQAYHPSRCVTKFNEQPLYLGYTTSAFGYVGRSVYQRILYLLKSYLLTMKTDAMVARKAGLLIAKIKAVGSIVDNLMQSMAGIKRNLLKQGGTDDVLSIDPEEDIESLNLQNVNNAMETSRKNILNNIASGAGLPAIMINEETFAEGFGEGTEDARVVARYVHHFRNEMAPLYDWFDEIVRRRAWTPELYATIQAQFPDEYGDVKFEAAYSKWAKSFTATWPPLLEEPESEKAKAEDVKLKALIAIVEVLLPTIDPENKAKLVEFMAANINAMEVMFTSPLILDYEALAEYVPPVPTMGGAEGEAKPPRPEDGKA